MLKQSRKNTGVYLVNFVNRKSHNKYNSLKTTFGQRWHDKEPDTTAPCAVAHQCYLVRVPVKELDISAHPPQSSNHIHHPIIPWEFRVSGH